MAAPGAGSSTQNTGSDGTQSIPDPYLDTSSAEKRKADQMDSPEEQPTIKLIEVDPDGDLVFRVGVKYTAKSASPLDIKVNRHTMSLGSPIFAKMLVSDFLEGQAGLIDLPEDSPLAFLEYCKILHHKTTGLDHLTGQEVWELALIADMRQSQHVLKPWILGRTEQTYARLRKELKSFKWIEPAVAVGDFERASFNISSLIEIAAVFSHAECFWDATRYLCARAKKGSDPTSHRKQLCLPITTNPTGEDVHEFIVGAAQEYRKHLLRESFKCARRHLSLGEIRCGRNATCQFRKHGLVQMILSDFTMPPESIEDWWGSAWLTLELVDQAARTMLIGEYDFVDQTLESECTMMEGVGGKCSFCKRDFCAEFTELVKHQKERLQGVCLTCFKAGEKEFFTTKNHAIQHQKEDQATKSSNPVEDSASSGGSLEL